MPLVVALMVSVITATAVRHGRTLAGDILPGMVLLSVVIGSNPMLMMAMGEVSQSESGLASGMVEYRVPARRRAGA